MAAARGVAGKLLGIVVSRLSPEDASSLLGQLCASFPAGSNGQPKRFEDQSGSLGAAGFVLAQCSTGNCLLPFYSS